MLSQLYRLQNWFRTNYWPQTLRCRNPHNNVPQTVVASDYCAHDVTPSMTGWPECSQTRVHYYRSAQELLQNWRRYDRSSTPGGLTMLLQWSQLWPVELEAFLPREFYAERLILVPSSDGWSSHMSAADLSLRAPLFGWGAIEVIRELHLAMAYAQQSIDADEQLVAFISRNEG